MWSFVAVIAVPILATLWTVGLGVMAARRKPLVERLLCGGLALAGAVIAAGGWLLLGLAFSRGMESFAGLGLEFPRITPPGGVFLLILGVLAVVAVVRRWRAKLQGS